MHFLATLIQKIWKGHVMREHFLLMKRSQVVISSRFRGFRVSIPICVIFHDLIRVLALRSSEFVKMIDLYLIYCKVKEGRSLSPFLPPPPPPPPPEFKSYKSYCTTSSLDCFIRQIIQVFLLAHLSRRLVGELIVYPWSRVRPPSVVCRCPQFQTCISLQPFGR